jgi:two-component SAPR family response regulator
LCFLLEAETSEVDDILGAVFEDGDAKNASGYFHLIRTGVRRGTNGALSITYDKGTRRYRVAVNGVRLEWDVQRVRRALQRGGEGGLRSALETYTGAFLPRSDTEWATITRTDLEWQVSKVGLPIVQDVMKRGLYERAEGLARRLLEVNPVDVALALIVVECVSQIRGVLAGQQELERLKQQFVEQIGVVPEPLRISRVGVSRVN